MRFADWLKIQETSTSTGDIAIFARPFITGGDRMYPEPITVDDLEKKKKRKLKEGNNHLGEKQFTTYRSWIRAIMAMYPNAQIEGGQDIANALVNGKGVGEWDGVQGVIYNVNIHDDPHQPIWGKI